MAAQQNLLRALKLIRLLKQRPGKTLRQLAQLLDCDPRHARRFLDTLEEVGFFVEKEGTRPPRFFLFEDERRQQAEFTEEEAELLQQALTALPSSNPVLAPLRQKIFSHSTLFPLADSLLDGHKSGIVTCLHEAIRNRQQVRLLRYYSANSDTVSDRLVEPHSFSPDYSQLTLYEPASDTVKTFKIGRMEAVELLDTPQTRPPAEAPTDPFEWPGEPVRVSLALTQMAAHLLTEDHPLTRPDLHPAPADTAFPCRYTGEVRSWVGIGRFILGLPGHVRIDAPEGLRAYVQGRIGDFVL
ncbi:MAG: WYL domain-containing protein [Cytophagales bacterium]|nr:MAG: WYL domain-containing protein [Cytophagales bacterium]